MAIMKEQRFDIMSVSWLCNRLYCQYMVLKQESVMIRLESFSLYFYYTLMYQNIIKFYQYEIFISMIVLLLPCMTIYVTLPHNISIWRSSMTWKLFSSRSTPQSGHPSNQDTFCPSHDCPDVVVWPWYWPEGSP